MIHIACNIDSNFTIHCAVTLTSLFANNRNSEFCVHIIASTLPEADQKALSSIAESYGNKICFYFPEKDLLNNFSIKKSGNRISIATYYRCLLSRILPVNIDKILYIDCDIVVLNDISEFWNTDITQYAIGCIEDIGSDEEEYYSRLQYDKKYSYFNAGVLLINLKYWREHKIDEMCEQYFLAHSDRIRFNDQDLLNALLYKDKLFVPFHWNVQDTFYRRTYSHKVKEHSGLKEALLHPAILHYTNKKPWNYDSMHPLKQEYFKYLDMTPWKGTRPIIDFQTRVITGFKRLLYITGIKKSKYINLKDYELAQ